MNLKRRERCPEGLRILMSIRPEWTEKIFAREKVIEVRRTAPHIENERQFPIKVYVYETKGTKTKPGAGGGDRRVHLSVGMSDECRKTSPRSSALRSIPREMRHGRG